MLTLPGVEILLRERLSALLLERVAERLHAALRLRVVRCELERAAQKLIGIVAGRRRELAFRNEPITNSAFHHVADGVIHLAFTPYDGQGRRLGFDTRNRSAGYEILRSSYDGALLTASSDVKTNASATVVLLVSSTAVNSSMITRMVTYIVKRNPVTNWWTRKPSNR